MAFDLLTDDTGKTIFASGTAQISTSNYKTPPASLYLDGGGYIYTPDSPDFVFSNNNFSVKGSIYPTANATNTWYTWVGKLSGTYGSFYVAHKNSVLYCGASSSGSSWDIINPSADSFGTLNINAWNDFEATRVGNTITLKLNGVVGKTITTTATLMTNTVAVSFGAQANGAEKAQGYMDDVEIIKNGITVFKTSFSTLISTSEYYRQII